MWEYQMLPLSEQGMRCIALDRRGHGRSDDPGRGYDFDTLADDVAALLQHLDLHAVTLVGHSMGCCELVRYLSRYGTERVERAVLVSAITPYRLQTSDNPDGVPLAAIDVLNGSLLSDRPRYFADGAITFFGLGSTWPQPPVVSPELVQWLVNLGLHASPKALRECQRSSITTDFRPDMRACLVPTLVIHGDKDTSAPLERCGRRTAQMIEDSELRVYGGAAHGLFLTEKERLTHDLATFILVST